MGHGDVWRGCCFSEPGTAETQEKLGCQVPLLHSRHQACDFGAFLDVSLLFPVLPDGVPASGCRQWFCWQFSCREGQKGVPNPAQTRAGMGLLRDSLAVLVLQRGAAAKYKTGMLKQMLQHPTTAALFFKISSLLSEVKSLWCAKAG